MAKEGIDNQIVELIVSREDAMRGRIRTRASDGEDVVIDLPRGKVINHGDMIPSSQQGHLYKIDISPEPVLKVALKKSGTSEDLENAIKLGYHLGTRHLEVLIEEDAVFIPISIGESTIRKILDSASLPLKVEQQKRRISMNAEGYHPGEEEDH